MRKIKQNQLERVIKNESRFLSNIRSLKIAWQKNYVDYTNFFNKITTLTQFTAISYERSSNPYYTQISDIIVNNKDNLREISLTNNMRSKNMMTDQSCIQLCNALRNNSTITSLYLDDYFGTIEQVNMFMETIKTMSALTKLELLGISEISGSASANIIYNALQNHPSITSLGMLYWGHTDDAKAFHELLKNSPKLSEIKISCRRRGEIIALNQIIQDNNSNITSIVFKHYIMEVNLLHGLGSNQKITKLELTHFRSAEELAKLLQWLQQMNSLTDLTINNFGSDEQLALFCDYLQSAKIQRLTIKLFKETTDMEVIEKFIGVIENHKTITTLSVNNLAVGCNSEVAFRKLLMNNKTLTDLTLTRVDITEEFLAMLEEVLESNSCPNLESLAIKEKTIFSKAVMQRFCAALSKNETLRKFKCGYVGYYNAQSIYALILNNNTIEEMDLRFDYANFDDVDGVFRTSLVEALKMNKNITKFTANYDLEDYEPYLENNRKLRNEIRQDFIILMHNLTNNTSPLPMELWHIIFSQTKIQAVDKKFIEKVLKLRND